MIINFSPVRSDESLQVIRDGESLIFNGVCFDFSPLADGAILPQGSIDSGWVVGDVERIDSVIHITLKLPHGANAGEASRFPSPLVNPLDGILALPTDKDTNLSSEEEV